MKKIMLITKLATSIFKIPNFNKKISNFYPFRQKKSFKST